MRKVTKDYIPELSEVRMVRRAPDEPLPLSAEDRRYIEGCLRDVEAAFGFEAFPALAFEQIPARALIGRFIDWWRGIDPQDDRQETAHARLPAAIRLLDTISAWREERAQRSSAPP